MSEKLKIGQTVTLKNSFLLNGEYSEIVALGGVPLYTTPIMVVVETFHNPTKDFDASTGELYTEKSPNSSTKYKCCWFSTKSMTLEYNWFKAFELIEYKIELPINNSRDFKTGDTVRFVTVDEEAGKVKSMKTNEQKFEKSQPLLSFVAPAFLVIGWANYEIKDNLIDPQTGEKIRCISQKLVKCKFYNEFSEKFSEILIPVECLYKIKMSEDTLKNYLKVLQNSKKDNSQILIKTNKVHDLGNFQDVSVQSGRYQARFISVITGKPNQIWLDEISIGNLETIKLKNELTESYPDLRTENQPQPTFLNAVDYVKEESEQLKGKIVYIGYINLKNEFHYRFIKVNQFHDLNINNKPPNFILQAYCFYRSDDRIFSSKGLISIQLINEKSIILNLFEKLESKTKSLNDIQNLQSGDIRLS